MKQPQNLYYYLVFLVLFSIFNYFNIMERKLCLYTPCLGVPLDIITK